MHRIYVRRRIVAGVIVALPILLILYLLTKGGGGGKPSASHTTSTTAGQQTTTTVQAQPIATMATWHLPLALSRSVVLPLSTNLGIFGGRASTGVSGHIYQIDPASGTATDLGSMPVPVRDAAGAEIGSSYFVFGGSGSSAATSDVQEFMFGNSTHMAGSVAANLPQRRDEMQSVTANGTIYVVGGFDGSQYQGNVLSSPDANTFTTLATLKTPVRYSAVAALGGMLYVIGGEVAPRAADSTAVQQVNLQSGAVTQLAALPTGISHAEAVTLGGTIYLLGGRSGGHAVKTISAFDPHTGALSPAGTLPTAESDMGMAMIGQTVYLIGGENDAGHPLDSVVMVHLGGGATTGSP